MAKWLPSQGAHYRHPARQNPKDARPKPCAVACGRSHWWGDLSVAVPPDRDLRQDGLIGRLEVRLGAARCVCEFSVLRLHVCHDLLELALYVSD